MKKANLLFRYGLVAFLGIFGFFTAILVYDVHSVRKPVRDVFEEALTTNADLVEAHIVSWLDSEVKALEIFRDSIMEAEGDTRDNIVHYLNYQPQPAGYEYVMVAWDEDNDTGTYNNLANYNDKGHFNSSSRIHSKDYYKAHLEGKKRYLDPIRQSNTGILSLPVMVGFEYFDTDAQEKKTGVVVGFLGLDALKSFNINFYNTGHISVVDITDKDNEAYVIGEATKEDETIKIKTIFFENRKWRLTVAMSDGEIAQPVNALRTKVISTSIPVASICVALTILMIYTLLKRISKMKEAMDSLTTGDKDLTKRLPFNREDAITRVMASCNNFVDITHQTVKSIKDSKDEVAKTYESLNKNVAQNKVNIEKSMNALMNATMEYNTMSGASENTASAMVEINANIDSLNRMIETQASAITQASASIEEMIGNINSVTRSVESMAQEFELLLNATKMGIDKNKEVNEMLNTMQESSKVLLEANKAIANVASQTNLLAMNAAIEAAHAGNFGKGFSVVADEIRNLAEESSKQSKQIGNELKSVSEQISIVVGQAGISTEAFTKVNEEINNTNQLVVQIRNAMMEQETGSKQVLEALSAMNNSTSEVREASNEMKAGSKQVNDLMVSLNESQNNLKKAFTEMDTQMSNMQESTSELSRLNKNLGAKVDDISNNVNQFHI